MCHVSGSTFGSVPTFVIEYQLVSAKVFVSRSLVGVSVFSGMMELTEQHQVDMTCSRSIRERVIYKIIEYISWLLKKWGFCLFLRFDMDFAAFLCFSVEEQQILLCQAWGQAICFFAPCYDELKHYFLCYFEKWTYWGLVTSGHLLVSELPFTGGVDIFECP